MILLQCNVLLGHLGHWHFSTHFCYLIRTRFIFLHFNVLFWDGDNATIPLIILLCNREKAAHLNDQNIAPSLQQ